MKKSCLVILICLLFFGCKPIQKPFIETPLYQVLTGDEYTGASFNFFETITTAEEFNALLSDAELSKFIKKKDIETSNFIIANLGEKDSEGYLIKIKSIQELPQKIVIAFEEIAPKRKSKNAVLAKPYCIIRINSKKEIEIIE